MLDSRPERERVVYRLNELPSDVAAVETPLWLKSRARNFPGNSGRTG